ncbi:hypothetical protein ABFS83_05G093900 [Erythranthe nasuta]
MLDFTIIPFNQLFNHNLLRIIITPSYSLVFSRIINGSLEIVFLSSNGSSDIARFVTTASCYRDLSRRFSPRNISFLWIFEIQHLNPPIQREVMECSIHLPTYAIMVSFSYRVIFMLT